MKHINFEKMMSLEGGKLATTFGNSFFVSLTVIGVIASALSGGALAAYHKKFWSCINS